MPMITWNLGGQRMNADAGDVQQSLKAIRDYSVFQVLVITVQTSECLSSIRLRSGTDPPLLQTHHGRTPLGCQGCATAQQ